MHELSPPNGETYLDTEQTLRWLSYVGNDERKLLILLALNQANAPLSRTGLHRELSDLAESKLPGNSAATDSFVKKSLDKVGAVEHTEIEVVGFAHIAEPVPAYTISPVAREFGISLAGALLQWSLEHQELSLNQVLGITHGDGPKQAPLLRYWMLYDLATTPDNPRGPSISHIATNISAGKRAKQSAVDRLVQFGVAAKETLNDNNQRQFQIVESEYQLGQGSRPFARLKPEAQLIFKTIQVAAESKDTWEFDEFFALAEQLYPDTDYETMLRARRRLSHTLIAPRDPFFKRYVKDLGGKQYDGGGRVYLTPEKQKAVLDLVSIIDSFCSGQPGAAENGRKIADVITTSPELFCALYLKAHERSNYANQDESIDRKIKDIIKTLGPLASAQAIRKVYSSESGRKVVLPVIYESLGRLMQAGVVELEKRPQSKQKQRVTGFYSLVEETESTFIL